MLPEVIGFGHLELDVQKLLEVGQKAFNINLAAELDKNNISINNPSSILTILANMKQPVDHYLIQKNPGNLLDHLFFSFLVISEESTIKAIREQTKLFIHAAQANNKLFVSIISATFSVWRDAIISGISVNSEYELRLFLDKCLLLFEKEDYKIFAEYIKKMNKDGTFELVKIK